MIGGDEYGVPFCFIPQADRHPSVHALLPSSALLLPRRFVYIDTSRYSSKRGTYAAYEAYDR